MTGLRFRGQRFRGFRFFRGFTVQGSGFIVQVAGGLWIRVWGFGGLVGLRAQGVWALEFSLRV